jgi:hypothetical protein
MTSPTRESGWLRARSGDARLGRRGSRGGGAYQRGVEQGVAVLLGFDRAQWSAHEKGRREAWQHGTENVAPGRKRVRHGSRLQRRNGVAALNRGDGGELKQRRWHAASDRGSDTTLRHDGVVADRGCRAGTWGEATIGIGHACPDRDFNVGRRAWPGGVASTRMMDKAALLGQSTRDVWQVSRWQVGPTRQI